MQISRIFFRVYTSQQEKTLSALALANVEALTQDEGFDLDNLNNVSSTKYTLEL